MLVRRSGRHAAVLLPITVLALGCVTSPNATRRAPPPAPAPVRADSMAQHQHGDTSAAGTDTSALLAAVAQSPAPAATTARPRLDRSPRHGEWAMIAAGPGDSVRAWVVYPERPDRAPVVVVVHEIFGLSTWIRAVADQLAAEGYIAIAPDLLTSFHGATDTLTNDAAVAAIRTLSPETVQRRLDAVARYGMALPAALPKYGIIGFCWGGTTTFAHAVHSPTLSAAVVYYGASPPTEQLSRVVAPVLGLYGGSDARVDATIPPADSALRALGKTYEPHLFPGAGHGFLRAQEQRDGANLAAARDAWPLTISWLRRYLGS